MVPSGHRSTDPEGVMAMASNLCSGKPKRHNRTRTTGEGNDKPLQYSCLENPMDSMKRQRDRTLTDELSRQVGAILMLLEISGEITPDRIKR